ncbi:MAG TPA: alpha-amylase/4-alpha-glucanotransferase domain-containing protein [Candidatus Udaeobacter sp.]|jgi:alpha-amylase|nr:alpha-amylase/4-alpha-glucanotransferase domain-containing protein [Candidatus Udaeobacter sp.]
MRTITLTLIVHDHQPVGNFDGVIAGACDDAYDPFLGFLERHPRLRLGMHVSGPLIEWLAKNRPEHLDRLRALVARGQVEPWTGGFYEPILPAIAEDDRHGQILAMSDWIESRLGARPRGLWLTERVWEPGLATTLSRAGVEYTAVDDAHFAAAGFELDRIWGSFLTEDEGRSIRVLPIHRALRYAIPFEAPQRTIELLRSVASEGEGRLAVLGDDGEKFGVWPGTHELCWDQRWLDRFAEALEREPWIEVLPPGEAIARHPPLGLAYLPSASYHEMEEWALPPAAQRRRRDAAHALERSGTEYAHDLLRGGHWRSFLTRYPEANRLHKRGLRASGRLHALEDRTPEWNEAQRHLWRSQCNCAYWHGVFGGLYLPHLREALWSELIAVERYCASAAGSEPEEVADFDLDGFDDALLAAGEWAAWLSARGGTLWGFDDRERLRNWCDTLARRDEAYHDQLAGASAESGAGHSIHAAIHVTEGGLEALARRVDPGPRDSFLERWTEGGRTHEWRDLRFGFLDAPEHSIELECASGDVPTLTKRYRRAAGGGLEARITLAADRDQKGELEVALNLGVHVPNAKDRLVTVNGTMAEPAHFAASASHAGVRALGLLDRWAGVRLDVEVDRDAHVTRAPIETVSLSERGAERVFQGLEARFGFAVDLRRAVPWSVTFLLRPGAERAA